MTMASGAAFFSVSEDQRRIDYRLTVNLIERMTAAHIHLGRRGENGPIVVFLFGPVSPGISVVQEVVTGTFTQEDLVGPLSGESLSTLITEMLGRQHLRKRPYRAKPRRGDPRPDQADLRTQKAPRAVTLGALDFLLVSHAGLEPATP